MGRRAELSTVLIVGGIVLLISIAIGIGMGDRVLGQIGLQVPVQPTPVPSATSVAQAPGDTSGWKRVSVMAVATDPGFSDPRVPPPPPVVFTSRPEPKVEFTAPPARPSPTRNAHYTSPPMPLPLVKHTPVPAAPQAPEETPPPATPRPYLTLPPVAVPTTGN